MFLCIIFIVSSWPQCQRALKADILSLDPEGARHGSRHGSNIHWDLFVLSSVCFRYVIANILFLPLYARLGVASRSAYVEASISTCVTFRGFRKKQRPWMDMIGRNVMPRSFSDDVDLGYILSILITNKRSCPGSPPRWGGPSERHTTWFLWLRVRLCSLCSLWVTIFHGFSRVVAADKISSLAEDAENPTKVSPWPGWPPQACAIWPAQDASADPVSVHNHTMFGILPACRRVSLGH